MTADLAEIEVSDNTLLGGSVRLRQPAKGYRVAIDPVLLAASVPARDREHIAELGSGVGAASLCLARRVAGCQVVGVELQVQLAALGNANAAENGLAARVEFVAADITALPARISSAQFDHVMANPPFHRRGDGPSSPDPIKAGAECEGLAGLEIWLDAMIGLLSPKGRLTLIHQAERLDQILASLRGRVGKIVVCPIWPRSGVAAKRVLVSARRGMRTPLRLAPGLVLHAADGTYTHEAQAILRGGRALAL